MRISLTPEMERLIDERVESGLYHREGRTYDMASAERIKARGRAARARKLTM